MYWEAAEARECSPLLYIKIIHNINEYLFIFGKQKFSKIKINKIKISKYKIVIKDPIEKIFLSLKEYFFTKKAIPAKSKK